MAQVVMKFDQLGNVRIEGVGFVGNTCDAATKPFETLLAGRGSGVKDDKKPEYFESGGQEATETNRF